ncbi:MAG TPA: hypothetical protein D7I00_01765, partial [Candidatus Poseidoniales archaeon]
MATEGENLRAHTATFADWSPGPWRVQMNPINQISHRCAKNPILEVASMKKGLMEALWTFDSDGPSTRNTKCNPASRAHNGLVDFCATVFCLSGRVVIKMQSFHRNLTRLSWE